MKTRVPYSVQENFCGYCGNYIKASKFFEHLSRCKARYYRNLKKLNGRFKNHTDIGKGVIQIEQ